MRKRGQLMQAAATGPSGMAAVVGSNTAYVEEVCRAVSSPDEVVVISNDNSSKQLVISGHLAALDRATDALVSDGLFVERLKVSAPFHSPYMKSAAFASGAIAAIVFVPPASAKGSYWADTTPAHNADNQRERNKRIMIRELLGT